MLSVEDARKVSLIEVLLDDAVERFPHLTVEAPPEAEALTWSEDQIREFFSKQLDAAGGGGSAGDGGGSPRANGTPTAPSSAPSAAAPQAATPKTEAPQAAAAGPARPAPVSDLVAPELLSRWFPGLKLSRTATPNPRLRLLAFHSAGNAEDMWTSEGTGVRRSSSPLLEWCRANQVELLALQLPGRGGRTKEPFLTTAQDAASEVLAVVTPLLTSGVPYAVLSHSFGCWVCFEFLRAARRAGLAMPVAWCLSAMPYPDVPEARRPWRRQRTLGDADFKDEMRGWDVNEVVFSGDMWPLYEPILRADCTVFDQYDLLPDPDLDQEDERVPAVVANGVGASGARGTQPPLPPPPVHPFGFPIQAFWGTQDRRVLRELVAPWSRYTTGPFRLDPVEGNHLWPLNNREAKAAWLQQLVAALERVNAVPSGSQ